MTFCMGQDYDYFINKNNKGHSPGRYCNNVRQLADVERCNE